MSSSSRRSPTERRQIAALIDELDDAQLATQSLCAGWDVKTVAAHLVSVFADGFWVFQWTALRQRGVASGASTRWRAAARELPAAQIAAALRQGADHELSPPITGPLSGLTDVLVHGGDIRIPLGLPFDPDPHSCLLALDFLTGPRRAGIRSVRRLRGISLQGSDIDRSLGKGAEIRGPVRALMMAARAGSPWCTSSTGRVCRC